MPDFQNPHQEPGSERRLLLVFVLTAVALFAFQLLSKKYFPQPSAPQQQTQQAPQTQPTVPAAATASGPVATSGGATKQAASETETVIENDLYRITFTNRGAQVKSWILKKFDNEAQNGRLDLVNPVSAPKYGYPLSLWTYDESLRNRLSSGLYVASREGALTSPTSVTFEYSQNDLAVRKTFSFDNSYVITVQTSVTVNGTSVEEPIRSE